MLRTKKDEVIRDSIPLIPQESYRLSIDDKFIFRLISNDGKPLIDAQIGATLVGEANVYSNNRSNFLEYWIMPNGMVKLPIIGEHKLVGLTVQEAQHTLEVLYGKFYEKPYAIIEVTNKRVIVFNGSPGSASVINLSNNNTTLMEVIAQSGGIMDRGQSKKIKIFRQTKNGRQIYEVDLSRVEGLKYTDMVIQGNDYIYIEPLKQLNREFLNELSPILSLFSTSLLVYSILTGFN